MKALKNVMAAALIAGAATLLIALSS